MKHLRRIAAALALLAMIPHVAQAASGTITVLDGNAAAQKYQVTVLGTGVFIGNTNICDPTGTPCAAVTANGLKVDATSGTINTNATISGTPTVIATQPTGTQLHTVCDSGCSSSTAPADESAFTFGTTPQSPVGGFFQTTPTSNALTTGQMGAFQVTANRALFVNPRNSSGTEIATAANPYRIDPTGTTTQPVSGTVTGNQGTAAAVAGAWPFKLTDGTNTTAVKAGSTAAAAADPSAVVALSPNSPLPAGTAVIGALSANQSVNLAQVAGATTATGNGTAAGSVRTAIASDNSNSPGIGGSATGSAVPSAAHYFAGNGSGNLTGVIVCDQKVVISQTASAQIITGAASKKTYICAINLVSATAQGVGIVEGTGTTCATGTAGVTGGTTAATGWNFAANGGIAQGTGVGVVISAEATAADNLCLLQSSTGQVSGYIRYTQL